MTKSLTRIQYRDIALLEERNFLFEYAVQALRSTRPRADRPLDLLAMTFLFHELRDNETRDVLLSKIEEALRELPDILDSGLQIRDCTLAAGYYYVAQKASRDTLAVDQIVLDRLKFAAKNSWLDDAQLATAIALISDLVQVGRDATQYLRSKIDGWLSQSFTTAVAQYCLVADIDRIDEISDFLVRHDWSREGIATLSWALLALNKLWRHDSRNVQSALFSVAQDIMGILEKELTGDSFGTKKKYTLASSALTNFDLALSAYALSKGGFSSVIGVNKHQREALYALLDLRSKLISGGAILSRRGMFLFGLVAFGFMLLLSVELLRLTGLEELYKILLSIAIPSAIWLIGWLFARRGPPLAGITKLLFGDNTMKAGDEKEEGALND